MRKGSFKASDVYKQYRNESGLDSWIWKTEATASEIEEAIERLDSVATVLEAMDQSCEKALQYFEYYTQQSGQKSVNNNAGTNGAGSNGTGSNEPGSNGNSAQDSIQLTTIFRAKGCEYNHVHLPFWDKDAFPYVNRASGTVGSRLWRKSADWHMSH